MGIIRVLRIISLEVDFVWIIAANPDKKGTLAIVRDMEQVPAAVIFEATVKHQTALLAICH